MRTTIHLRLLLLLLPIVAHGQVDWQNYSTSFQGNGKEGVRPMLATAIPENGLYGAASYGTIDDDSKLLLADSFRTSAYKWPRYIGVSTTIGTGDVYFLAPGVHASNANRYEVEVIRDGSTTIQPWGPITRFTDRGVQLNEFLPYFGFLGGYEAPIGHSILAAIRDKSTGEILSAALVRWEERPFPGLRGFYSVANLPGFIGGKTDYWNWHPDSATRRRVAAAESGKLVLQPEDNSPIFYVAADVYRRNALEYQLSRDGAIIRSWQPNDFDNSFIFLRNLHPGKYLLQIRLSAERDEVGSYRFTILPAWWQTSAARIGGGILAVLSLAAIILLLVVLRQRAKTKRERADHEKLNIELRSIRAQLNPHFVFNALSSIQGLVNRNETDAANLYLSEFGQLLREALATGDNDFTVLLQEIVNLNTYLKLEQLRFGFQFSIETDATIPATETQIPAFLLQPLVENAVKHGIAGCHERGRIRILFSRESTTFIARVIDNGQGWERESQPGAGFGLKLTRERIRLLNVLLRDRNIVLNITSAPGQGSTITLLFNNWWL